MAEELTIIFKGIDEISKVIDDIREKLEALESEGEEEEYEDLTINISGDGLEADIEQIMWDIIDKIKTRAVQDGAEFLLNAE